MKKETKDLKFIFKGTPDLVSIDRVEFCNIQIMNCIKELELWKKERLEAITDLREENSGEYWKNGELE